MKIRHLSIVLLLVLSLCTFRQGVSQGVNTLFVASMPGFPDLPLDSAYEGQAYSFVIELVNNSNIVINNTTVNLNIRVDSITSILYSNPQTAMQPGDSILITVPIYNFTQPQYKTGNNIVVVWPVVNGLSVPVDSSFYPVFFIPLSSVGGIDLTEPSFKIFPVPVRNLLHLNINGKNVEDVRFWTITGQQVDNIISITNDVIDVEFLAPGVYILDMLIEGTRVRRKFIRE